MYLCKKARMSKQIPNLIPGDKIMIVSPAKSIEPSLVFEAKEFWENQGFKVVLGEYCMGQHHYFSGTDEERRSDFQEAIDNPEIKAIICARGGYGCIRILDKIQWAAFIQQPKWIVGFSDITVIHQRIHKYGLKSIHATMPLNYSENSSQALETLVKSVKGELKYLHIKETKALKKGKATGRLIGGNLSILYSLLGTDDQADYTDSILFIEDLAEQIYHLDRMFYAFEKAGIFQQIKGLIIGSFTDLKDTEVPFGKSFQETLLEHFHYRNIPIVMDFPAGHIPDNRALILGSEIILAVEDDACILSFLNI